MQPRTVPCPLQPWGSPAGHHHPLALPFSPGPGQQRSAFTFLVCLGLLGRVHLHVAFHVVGAGESGRGFCGGRLGQLLPQVGQGRGLGAERLLLEGGEHAGRGGESRQLHGAQAAVLLLLLLLQVQNILHREGRRCHRAREHCGGQRGSGRSPGSWKRRWGAAEEQQRCSVGSRRGLIAVPTVALPCALPPGRSAA